MEYKVVQQGAYKYYLPIVVKDLDDSWRVLGEKEFRKNWPLIGYEINDQGIFRIYPFYSAKLIYETFGVKLCQINLRTSKELDRTYYIDADHVELAEDECFIFTAEDTIAIAKKSEAEQFKLKKVED